MKACMANELFDAGDIQIIEGPHALLTECTVAHACFVPPSRIGWCSLTVSMIGCTTQCETSTLESWPCGQCSRRKRSACSRSLSRATGLPRCASLVMRYQGDEVGMNVGFL